MALSREMGALNSHSSAQIPSPDAINHLHTQQRRNSLQHNQLLCPLLEFPVCSPLACSLPPYVARHTLPSRHSQIMGRYLRRKCTKKLQDLWRYSLLEYKTEAGRGMPDAGERLAEAFMGISVRRRWR
ncbi:uncharacterized protein BT62DRAFT_999363 [Guyanagaster necrorhizus]|uniref:Uncharacterized protein n=1 Tax=Guyanagaster necrorhizus TaxID=856835 RepID=A0A9P7W3W1_9AGAR|nr:uncharacterized protein BT62DRAFT_999363 [Guyanagaster necrorhizus MCA 3950]KAG7451692.1 hypothetical protein BT62DRAFT_999363 [Guyanagaster necrorhizus MCA 3950]